MNRFLLFALLSLLFATSSRAQYELRASNFNAIYTPYNSAGAAAAPSGPPVGSNNGTLPATANSNYMGAGNASGSSNIIDVTPNDATAPGTIPTAHADRFPANTGKTIVLLRSSIGGMFASGVPRYFMGDVISVPVVQADGQTLAPANFWRVKPVEPGETLNPVVTAGSVVVTASSTSSPTVTVESVPSGLTTGARLLGRTVSTVVGTTITLSGGNAEATINTATVRTFYTAPTSLTPIPLTNVNVVQSNTGSNVVTVAASPPPQLVVGATLLGQPITNVIGTVVTLAANANQTISSSTSVPITPALTYYYSPHAEKVYASQPGRVNVTWVSLNTTGNGGYELMTETFAVSSNTLVPARTIFWTEGSFDGPKVLIRDTRITAVSPAYYNVVPRAVAQEVQIPGYTPLTPNLTTLSFARVNGIGQLSAYNVEGRLLIEYLGNIRLAGNVYESLGIDIVDLKRAPDVSFVTTHLGDELLPHDANGLLEASPVLSGTQQATSFYGTQVRPDGSRAYHAERETSAPLFPDPEDDEPASADAYNKVVLYWLETGTFNIQWPVFQDRYWLRWSPYLADYAHYTVSAEGSTPATGMGFTGGTLPQIIFQDDPAQTEAQIDLTTQRLFVNLSASTDKRNRSLLKFTNSNKVWYVNLYTQAEDRQISLSSTTNGSSTVTVGSTQGLEAGMVVTGPGITGQAVILRILSNTQLVLSTTVAGGSNTLTYSVQSDALAPIASTASVGTRLTPPAGHENAGFISSGTGYYPAGYLNPFTVGVEVANQGAIIPVNALPTDNQLTVRWFKKVSAPSAEFQDLYVPGKVGRYTIGYPPSTTPEIVIAQGVGTDNLPLAEADGSIYTQNNPALPGYNPNEEHALMLGGRAYALREDLNVTSGGGYTSQPFVLVAYTDPADDRPAIHAYKVVRSNGSYDFDYTATAGTLLVKPYPLPLMDEPLKMVNGEIKTWDTEVTTPEPITNTTLSGNVSYSGFTFTDRKGFTWIHRGPHDAGSPSLQMKLYYKSRAGFFVPGTGELPADTILPFLRASGRSGQPLNLSAINPGQADDPLMITYTPVWPADAPELRVGETLTLPKFGLPQVRGQMSAEVLYQQSLARAAPATTDTQTSAVLIDPTRERTCFLSVPAVNLDGLPSVIKTTVYQGRTYFQGLPPHLQRRFYYDPLRGTKGTLVFIGEFHDELAGEDYLDLNVLTSAEITLLENLVPVGHADRNKWLAAIQAVLGDFRYTRVKNSQGGYNLVFNRYEFTNNLITLPTSLDSADSYALTTTARGTGFVTLVFGNSPASEQQPQGDPVQIQVIKVVPELYTGDLKVVKSSNPLDEQVTLRHSADFAAKPDMYQFEWRWGTGEPTAPLTYSSNMQSVIGGASAPLNNTWFIMRDIGQSRPTSTQRDTAINAGALPLPRVENMRPVNYVLDLQGNPTSTVIASTSYTDDEMAAGFPSLNLQHSTGVTFPTGAPEKIIFSAELGDADGFILYVNGSRALAHNLPSVSALSDVTQTAASSGLSAGGLTKQFTLESRFFRTGSNSVELALFTQALPNTSTTLNFRLEAAVETDLVTSGTYWQTASDPLGKNTNMAPVGGSPQNPFGGAQFVLNDRWFTMRYRPKINTGNIMAPGSDQNAIPWSRWLPPQFVEGWVKRVLAAINPFEQRVKDLNNNAVNTDVSVLTQAGKRWEGDIALTLENINDVGLIEIYETVLNRAKNMSIDANTNDPDTNNALVLAAGYLNDLYTIVGNEAFADAANPTISIDDMQGISQVNTSRFSFEGQAASALDEELALLRGRDGFVSPGTSTSPAYNRLWWNYTQGINSGQLIYAVNYNIREKAGSSTANGVIDEADAQRMFPQGHGDAYGHYLTALTGYYRLISHPNFTWQPRAESVTVAGQPVTVDFADERKFAAAAGNVARTAQQICSLVHRQTYQDDPASGWEHFRDDAVKPGTTETRDWGLDEWLSRSTQGALYHWAVANALVPETDNYNSGVEKIDRSTVPELQELASAGDTFQTMADNASAHLNPLGLSPGAIAFDISPAELQGGTSHFEQVYRRATRTLFNAAGAFNQAATMSGSLRSMENQLDDFNTTIAQQETAYVNQLIDIYGRPYSGEIGAGRLYAQGYTGPDLVHWYIVDRPNDLVNTAGTFDVQINEAVNISGFTSTPLTSLLSGISGTTTISKTVKVQPSQFVQYNDVWSSSLGSRAETGELQNALLDTQMTWLALKEAETSYRAHDSQLTHLRAIIQSMVTTHKNKLSELGTKQAEILELEKLVRDLEITAQATDDGADLAVFIADAVQEFFPTTVGFSNDVTSAGRGAAKLAGTIAHGIQKALSLASKAAARYQQTSITELEQKLEHRLTELGFGHEEVQAGYEYDNLIREKVTRASALMQLTIEHQRALENVRNVIADGNRILAEREIFRQRAAAVIQGYRTRDVSFRLFRNEALEQYRTLFDLAARYSYLAAKSYDYETGLLGSNAGQQVFNRLIASRALGDLSSGTLQATVSPLGDSGLAGVMAQLSADFSVAEGRLGINNPDQYGTVFSLRSELFRLLNDASTTADDDAWRQTMEQHIVANIMTDSDVATYCRNIKKPDGSPVPGFVIPFSTTIQHAKNFFGLDLAAGDHAYTPSNYATKIYSVGVALPGYVGMDAYAAGNFGAGAPASGDPNALSATPYCYLIPCGQDFMLAPPLGDTNTLRTWTVHDQALPLPYNLGDTAFNSTQFFTANGTLSERPWIIRKHQAFRLVSDPAFFYSSAPAEFTNTRLIGRSVWNSQWKLVIPAYTLLSNEQEALNRFAASVRDIQIFLRTYSHSGN